MLGMSSPILAIIYPEGGISLYGAQGKLNMPTAIAFDVYGTLVNPLAIADHLWPLVGDQADRFAELWRAKQLEYSFRRGLMRAYRPFSVCTWQSLLYTEQRLGTILAEESRRMLIERYEHLPPFPDAAPGLASIRRAGHRVVAFSNGEAQTIRGVLGNANLLPLLDDVISVDEVGSFKPDPAVYAYAVERLGQNASVTWLVSSNPFDVIGAKTAGLRTAWIKRDPKIVFDPWGIEPDLVLSSLDQLVSSLGSAR
jgi:2-haloacid dehalogenase